jgi:non-specific serine/threonine protein kinase
VIATLTEFLEPRCLLLVLDNCEHVLAGCTALVTTLLHSCPQVRLLVTSRESLEVAGEQTYRVPPLSTPDPVNLPPVETLQRYEAVQLFLERARTRCSDLAVQRADLRAVAQICAQLDGLPLAIELAAARVSSLSIAGIATRLDHCFQLLTGGPRTALPRQQTLRATLDWSYILLSGPEQVLLRRLAVFSGGWMLEAAEIICAENGVAAAEVLDLLCGLVHKSLVVLDAGRSDGEMSTGEVRYRLLETVRQYWCEKLDASGEAAGVRDRHLAWHLTLAESSSNSIMGFGQIAWLHRLDAEHDNLRAALAWARGRGSPDVGLRLAGALVRFWEMRGYLGEGRRYLAFALSGVAQGLSAERARALHGAGLLAFRQGDHQQAATLYEEALTLRRAIGDRQGIAASLSGLGSVAREQGSVIRAVALQEEALALRRELSDQRGVAYSLHLMGMAVGSQGDYGQAIVLFEESLSLKRELGDAWSMANTLIGLGNVLCRQGNYTRAATLLEEGLTLKRTLGDRPSGTEALQGLARVACGQGQYERAMDLLREGLGLSRNVGARAEVAQGLLDIANVLTAMNQPMRAARLAAAAAAQRSVLGVHVQLIERADHELMEAAMRAKGGERAFAVAWAQGAAMTVEEAIADALASASGANGFADADIVKSNEAVV